MVLTHMYYNSCAVVVHN